MNRRPPVPARYELRIQGHLDQHWSTWFGGFALTREDDGTTTLRGTVTDQAELHGLLARIRDLGTTLILVRSIDSTSGEPTGGDRAVARPASAGQLPDEHEVGAPRRGKGLE